MENNNLTVSEEPGQNLEKIPIRHLSYLASLFTLLIFLASFIPYYHLNYILLPFFTFYFSYVFSYLFLFLIIFLVLIFTYKNKALHLKELHYKTTILGINPYTIIIRTGIQQIDIIGLIAGLIFCVLSCLFPLTRMFFPGFLLLTMSFLFSILYGSTKKRELKRR